MNREDIQKLLGGYATGTLTTEEQQALFAAALEDQELFDALGREQALRDLLREPAAKAQLLAALEAPERPGFWSWLRRPMAAGLATACVAGIATLAVWQGTRSRPLAAPVLVAEVKAPEIKAQEQPPTVAAGALEKKKVELPARREAASGRLAKDIATSANGPAAAALPASPPLPPPTAMPAPAPRATASLGAIAEPSVVETVPAQAALANALADQAVKPKAALDARSLFYGNAFVPNNGQVQQFAAGSGGAQSAQAKLASAVRAPSVAKKENAAFSLGVRVSLLRGDEEAAVSTVLNAGESVRLKVIPNQDGFLYVAARDGNAWKVVAGGPAQRLKPFETPALAFEGPGSKQLYVMLSLQAQTLSPEAIAALSRVNLVETVAEQDRATYAVAGALQGASPQQVVQPITLTYR
uniref:Uncharacterized protein n=1 Tax=Solibacter usitatus (strain Ellin6076) TaxID=234267 RepID=Q02C99_SOLUE